MLNESEENLGFLNIPWKDILFPYVFPYLDWKDLFRLRGVCTTTKLMPFEELCDIALTFLSGKQVSSEFLQHLDSFAGQHGLNSASLKNIVKSLIIVPQDAVKKGITASQLREDVIKIGLDEDKADSLVKKWESVYSSLASICQGKSLTINQLVDMEWKFGVTAASSEMNKVGSTFLQLKLTISTGSGQFRNVYMELSLPQFYSFLHEMEKAKASLDLVS